jgi:hypothetical protein
MQKAKTAAANEPGVRTQEPRNCNHHLDVQQITIHYYPNDTTRFRFIAVRGLYYLMFCCKKQIGHETHETYLAGGK